MRWTTSSCNTSRPEKRASIFWRMRLSRNQWVTSTFAAPLIPGAKEYDESLAAKNSKSPALPDKTWLDDPIEKARRLWEWWRANHNKFTYFSKAARLVVLVQTSSCAVERVFSQVKYILETVGDLVLEESLEARLMERINCGKY